MRTERSLVSLHFRPFEKTFRDGAEDETGKAPNPQDILHIVVLADRLDNYHSNLIRPCGQPCRQVHPVHHARSYESGLERNNVNARLSQPIVQPGQELRKSGLGGYLNAIRCPLAVACYRTDTDRDPAAAASNAPRRANVRDLSEPQRRYGPILTLRPSAVSITSKPPSQT